MGNDDRTQIGALIVSSDEPQLERCLQAVKGQTVPFSSITHINNIIPENVAFNKGMEKAVENWVLKIDGDMILYPNALEIISPYVKDDMNIFMYSFGLFDTFLNAPIMGCGVFLRPLFQFFRYKNVLANDSRTGRKLLRLGYSRKTFRRILIGTHCSEPDEFQIFRRFYTTGVKYGKKMENILSGLHKRTNSPLYILAIEAMTLGANKRYYPTSHNINFDRELFDEYKRGR